MDSFGKSGGFWRRVAVIGGAYRRFGGVRDFAKETGAIVPPDGSQFDSSGLSLFAESAEDMCERGMAVNSRHVE